MKGKRWESRLLIATYVLCFAMFGSLYLLKEPYDTGAVVMAVIICLLFTYGYIIIRKFFPDGDKFIIMFTAVFAVIGIATLYRIDTSVAIKQVVWYTIGMTGFIALVVLLPDLKSFGKYKYFFMIMTLIFMGMATFIGQEKNGSKNWVALGPIGFQPSEFGKIFFCAYLASALKDYKKFKDLIQPAVIVMISLLFMVLQTDLGSALIFFGIAITMLYISTSKSKYVVICFLLLAVGAVISYKLFPHVRVRVNIWLNPWSDYDNKGYQLAQSLMAIATGGFLGSGIGLGYPELVPVQISDFIFSVIVEELGIIVGFGIIILYFLLFYRCMRAAIFVQDRFSQLLAVGYSTMIACQVLVIIGGVIGAIPLTGITLPIISYGGTSMLTAFFSLGIIQKISEDA
ncbi:MAG: FtsW/RodA/SpoVE family cell cycle protein [Clostridiales bacterium]|uniref:FtsW/RodA/SpoVE family cell cycle protein n=1 Tax=Clostridium sp. N3C TaxID=1776758 RepID=UPI00092E1CC7|nr:FtsW/RodA/SpoVE family cell cycle protein [Clostridium sp. N3C]NLZ48688.1 FtsW/RodA/SpoVE family cell cycle protein [Clostridiales bacterium]SCN25915.1 Cell division protein FtsW [Clostridium sp. N3C]